MASTRIAFSGQFIRNSTGGTASGAKLYVYDAQSLGLASIFTDASLDTQAANPVVADAAGLMPFAYKGVGDYKVVLKGANGVTFYEQDNIPGAVETDTGTPDFARPLTPVIVKTADYITTVSDIGKVINCTVTGGIVQITLLSAVTADDGAELSVRHTGTANQVKIVTTSAQTITHPAAGVTVTAFSLVGYGESVTVVSDGANWHVKGYVPPLMTPNAPGVIRITDRLSAPPSSPTPGARYILTTSPSGAWSTFAQHDIAEATGQDTWFKYTPPSDSGWIAYVLDEARNYQFRSSAWVLGVEPDASDTVKGPIELAVKSEMETGTSTVLAVAPGLQHNHPGHPKVWACASVSGGTPTLDTSYNVTSITDTATGRLSVAIATDFSSANWACSVSVEADNGTTPRVASVSQNARAAGTVEVCCAVIATSVAVDPNGWSIVGFGDQ